MLLVNDVGFLALVKYFYFFCLFTLQRLNSSEVSRISKISFLLNVIYISYPEKMNLRGNLGFKILILNLSLSSKTYAQNREFGGTFRNV